MQVLLFIIFTLTQPHLWKSVISFNYSRERVHKRRLKEVVKEFSLMCRGLYGTTYAAATY